MENWVVFAFVVFSFSLLKNVNCEQEDYEDDGFAPVFEDDMMEHICEEPPPPYNGEMLCGMHKKKENRYVCKADCHNGYQFPNGKRKRRHVCNLKTGKWSPEYMFPDCELACNPPCTNGGECVEGNHCICTSEYRGDRCQYALALCDPNEDLVPADWSCNHTSEATVCVMNCPQGTRFEAAPSNIYSCSLDGMWRPSYAPKCIPINVIESPAAHGMFSVPTGQLISSALPNSGVCAVWGASHYRTFDGGMYSFQGPCTYLLSTDCAQNTFAIHIQNPELCETVTSCRTSVVMYIGSERYILRNGQEGGPVVENNDVVHHVPSVVNGLLFQMMSDYVTVTSSIGFQLKWNRKNTVLLKASSQLQNKTCGLCGKFDGSALNDFETSDKSITDSVEGFVNSWTMEGLGEKCEKKATVKDSCTENKERLSDAEKLCRAIFDNRFSACHQLVDPKAYYEFCKMDQCSCPFKSCHCGTLSEYFRECNRLGGKVDGGWRSSEICPLECPKGMVYQDCGTSCPKTCKKTVYSCEDSHCIDGCHCPGGMVLHNGKCLQKAKCPCMHNGKEYRNGERMLVDCNACECNAGKWECTKEKCEARCTSAGDPHYTTFDGLSYEFLGSCPYYLVYNDNFTIIQESGPCPKKLGNEPETEGMFCTNSIKVSYLDDVLFLQPDFKVTFNDKSSSLPLVESGITASMATDMFLKVYLENGVSMLWDGYNRIYIDAPTTLFGKTAGLCGTFNKNQNDDFLTPNQDIEADVDSFASRWKASDTCHKRSRRASRRTPCESQPQKLKDAEMLCSALKHEMFEACHAELDPSNYYKSCVSDLCVCNRDLKDCFCPIIADYSFACSKKGIIINWVDEITPCKPECSGGQTYQECGNSCTGTCAAIAAMAAASDFCLQMCVQGCTCPNGMALNNEGFCVAIEQCPCIYDGKEYLPSSVVVQGSKICTCQGAKWRCRPGTLAELATLDTNLTTDDASHKCLAEDNKEFTQCSEKCPRTCHNLHLPADCKTEECKPGCRCKEGFVYDSERSRCVLEKECGCLHGSRRYQEGETFKQSCNLCTCLEGVWKCTAKICPGVCSVWGDSHFKTFDGKIFDFYGDCEYILSKGKMKGASYSITIQNVPCGTSGITCSKSFTLDLGPLKTSRGDISEITAEAEKLTLTKDAALPKTAYSSRFVVLEAGLFVLVYTDIGVILHWDRGTRIYVTVEPKWRNRVKGLCGNFNDDQNDDFLTPSGGIPEVSASIFAESWKIYEFCPQPQIIEDACEIHTHRKTWAQQQCGIMKSDLFSDCHSEVAMEPFYERCIFDSCACDMGGDCECLCTAIAAYVQECNMHGVSIKWRSQELCPVQCEECSTYDSCIPSCPMKTCENGLVYDKIQEACSADFCLEGCKPKPCPEGQIYNDSREYKCIPEVDCVIPCTELNGRLYNEGDRVTDLQVVDACQSCHCLRGTVSCTGPPCADVEPLRSCSRTGWTPWMNTPAFVGGDFEILTDPRLKAISENYCGIANMTDIECRDSDSKLPYKELGQRVICRLPKGLVCKDEEQKDSVCLDYEIRAFCDCGPVPTTESVTMPVTTPLKLSPICEKSGWSAWMSGSLPNNEGEFETLDNLRVNHYFCADDEIDSIECRDVSTLKYVKGDEGKVVCNKKVGLVCKGRHCHDYEVRVNCKCGVETTVPPVLGCVTGWTEFFNVDHPDTSDTGDDESLERIREKHDFCMGGTIEDIECKAMVGGALVDYKDLDTFGLKCSKNVGFVCNKYVRTGKCEDFLVRFYCACENLPETTVPSTTVTTTTTTTPVPVTPVPVECGWTPWLNIDNPDSGEGDIEDLSKIQALYKTCGGKDLVDIECRMSRTLHKYSESLQNDLICDTTRGFQCLNDHQTGNCYDYEVRLLCMYSWCYPPTTTPIPTTPTTKNPCPDGQVYDTCAYKCNQLCMSFAFQLVDECVGAQDDCIAGCRPLSGCEPPHRWRDYQTCVSKRECPCTMKDDNGLLISLAPGEVTEKDCEKCQCLDNEFICHIILGCGVTEAPAVPRLLVLDITKKNCWTEWINLDNPITKGGDFETPILFRKHYEFCNNPIKAQCRTAVSHQTPFDVGQHVTCSADQGLICWNKENEPEGCYDYEIRFFCPCPTQPTTTTTPVPTLEPGICEYGWTNWFNVHIPEARGEYESIQSSRIYHSFCSSDMISAIECRQVGEPIGRLQRGVICELDIGLKCNPEFLDGEERCSDYEVRFFCECPGHSTVIETETETLPVMTTKSPVQLACSYWSEWINENHPTERSSTKKGGVKGGGVIRGDSEKVMLLKLQREYHFCMDGYISDIECREAATDLDYTEAEDNKLVCNVVSGFRCRGKDQSRKVCSDYKIRYFCACSEEATTPVITKTTTPEVYVRPCSTYYKLVDGPNPLPDSNLKASTSKDSISGPQSARINSLANQKSAGAWMAGKINEFQFIEIDLGRIQPVYGVLTKGRSHHQEWVKSYKILYSRDGIAYTYVKDPESQNGEKIFAGNYDSDSVVEHIFRNPFEARYVRIQPIAFRKEIAMRVDLLGCSEGMDFMVVSTTLAPLCIDEMGMYNGFIRDFQIQTSSDRNSESDGRYVRLNTPQTEEHAGGWVAGSLEGFQHVQIDFIEMRNLTGVKIQGRDMVPQWVTAFTVSYSKDGDVWNKITDQHGIKVFPGNYDSSTAVIVYFPQTIRTRFLRIHPVSWENWIAMRLEILGCFESYEAVKDEIATTPAHVIIEEHCTDPMGFENHQLPDVLISVSSSRSPKSDGSRIRLNTHFDGYKTGGWIAAVHDYMPVVSIDFYEPRNLTGILTQGLEDDNLWVISYKVRYSLDNKTWEFAADMGTGDIVFNGNFDRNSVVLRLFKNMILARYLEVIILDYHTSPALRMEIWGCFVPYPVYTLPPVLATTTELCVENGPWISLTDPASSSFGDDEPIDKIIAASGVCRNPYEIECRTLVTQKDYQQTGQIVSCDLSRGLVCKNRRQSSHQCYNYEVRIKCWSCGMEETTTPSPVLLCPEVPATLKENCPAWCPHDYICDGTGCVGSFDCPCFKEGKRFEPSNILITKDCQRCDCMLGGYSTCKPIKCPDCLPGQKSEMDSSCTCVCTGCAEGSRLCPTSGECVPEERWCDGVVDCPDDEIGCPTTTTLTPTTTKKIETVQEIFTCSTEHLRDTDTCEVVANVFETFDGTSYQYDICDHILMKDVNSGLFSVSIHKTCASEGSNSCNRYLVIEVDKVVIKLGPGIQDITVQDTVVPVKNLWLVSKRFQDFELQKRGNSIIFKSRKYNFDVNWDVFEDVNIRVSKCLLKQVFGLCGLYNMEMTDDFTMPNRLLAAGTEEFGDSWSIGPKERCEAPKCPPDVMRTAIDTCNELRENPFNSSCSGFVKVEHRIEACVVYMCDCLQRKVDARRLASSDVFHDILNVGSCKCEAYEGFVEACESARAEPVQEWRIRYDCTPECPAGMEWQDCGPGCELTCDNYHQREEICATVCVPGCYCPSGLIRHHNRCVKPKMCQDCVCRGHGDPNYITFDGRYYAFQGKCSYILAQHQTADEEFKNFRIIAHNVECPEEPGTSCTQGLSLYWNGHVIEKFKNKPVDLDHKSLSPADLPLDHEGISITYVPNKSTLIHIKDINLAIRYFDQMYGFNIELPAFFYFNKTEGLCGVCNFVQSDDMYHRDGYVTEDIEDFAYSWLEEHETRKNCEFPRKKLPPVKVPPGICNFTTSPCEIFLDPSLYSQACQNDVGHSRKPEASMCRSKFQYAQQCCERGVPLVEWLHLSGCDNFCPEGMVYECSSACPKTCDNYKTYQEDDCNLQPLYTCVCPEGEVLKLGQCVKVAQCEVCDMEGHIVGDVWEEGPCKVCECMQDLSTMCVVIECPMPPLCDVKETLKMINRAANACCDAYQCMPFAEKTCPESPLEDCPPGQAYVKDYVDNCPVYRCECIPDMCPPPVMPILDDGENVTLVTTGCCTTFEVTCDRNSCAPAPKCNPGFKLSTYQSSCCKKYKCVPKKNVCVYRHKYEVVNGSQVELDIEDQFDKEYEPRSSWQDGLCRKCSCVDSDGQFSFTCREEICPDPKTFPDTEKYYREEIHIPGACCPKYRRVACVVNGAKYAINEEWPSPTGDPCKSYRCVTDQKGEAIRLEKTTTCTKTCPEYAVYVEPLPSSGVCCGACKPVACDEDGHIYQDGEKWVSNIKPCFMAECSVTENGSRITYRGESCPIMPDNCAPENVKTDSTGCCTYCKVPTETCSAVEVPSYETRGFFGYVDKEKGSCSNTQVLHGLTKCGGQCSSNSAYSYMIGSFQSICTCCVPKESQDRNILLECEDGSKVTKVYNQPITCHCSSCVGSSRVLESLNKVDPYKK